MLNRNMADDPRERRRRGVEAAWKVLKAGANFIGDRYAMKRLHADIETPEVVADAYKRQRLRARRTLFPKQMVFRKRIIRRRPIRRRRIIRRRGVMRRRARPLISRPIIQKGLAAYKALETKYGYSNLQVNAMTPAWGSGFVSTCSEIAGSAAAGKGCLIYFTEYIATGQYQSQRIGRAVTWTNLKMRFTIVSTSAEAYCRWALLKTVKNPGVALRALEYANPNGLLAFTNNADSSWNHPYKTRWMDAQMTEQEVWKRYKLIKTGTIFMPEWDKSRRVNFNLKWKPHHRPTAWYDATDGTTSDEGKGQYFLVIWADSSEVFSIVDLYRQWSYTDA